MTFSQMLAEQLARPRGWSGRLLGHGMDFVNRKPTRLAIDLLAPSCGESILDAGCGTGAAMAEILRRTSLSVCGIDPSRTMVRQARKRFAVRGAGGSVRIIRTSIEDMPFPAASFDAILALNVLYFCDGEGRMITRLAKSLKPGGRLVAYVTHRDTMQHWAFAREGRHRLFDRDSLGEIFVAGGFAHTLIEVQEVAITRSVRGLLVRAER